MESKVKVHDWKPTHAPVPDEIIQAEENAAWAWKALDDLIEERDPLLTHLEPEWWERHAQLYKAACEAEDRLRQLRDAHLNGYCTCDPDPNREGATCPACREVLAEMAESELPY